MSNKTIVAIVILLTVCVFAWLADYGWKHRYGSPETYETIEPNLLEVSYRPQKLGLAEGDVFAEIWQSVPSVELALTPQMTEKPWPKGSLYVVNVQAYHDGSDIYFKMIWEDEQANTSVAVDAFPDGCAMATPVDADAPVRSIMMGFSSLVNIWHWRADRDAEFWQTKEPEPEAVVDFAYPFEQDEIFTVSIPKPESAVSDLLAQRAGSLTAKETQVVQGRGLWRDGIWHVVLKRSLTTADAVRDCQFAWGKRSASFAVWDGDRQHRGSRKSMSEWVTLKIEAPKAARATSHGETARPAARHWPRISFLKSAYGGMSEGQSAESDAEPRVITVLAKRFVYMPSQIEVQKGELITIRLESLDVTHGLFMDGYGVDIKARPGLIGKATFVADKPGRFTFRCSETCGEFHPYMVGFMEVTPNSRFGLFVGIMCVAFVAVLGIVFKRTAEEKGVQENVGTE
ncbi:MAG: ethylbenzene dehydrogenase-related protein [Planctomycetota bacterium]|jgi:heme/copper-type cytochrome/quinol oxidase subunit 2